MRRLLAILGPTASGKSDLALGLAEHLEAEILSVDSMQVYRGMDIGTAKATTEERRRVPHHMVDVADPEMAYTVANFQAAGRRVIEELAERPMVIVGGSGLHFRAIVDPMTFPPHDSELRRELEALSPGELRSRLVAADPEAGRHVDLANHRRVLRAVEVWTLAGETPSGRASRPEAEDLRAYRAVLPFRAVGLDPGALLAARVERRLSTMRTAGLLEEVGHLANRLGPTASQAVGYKQLVPVVQGRETEEEGWEAARRATLALAKRQRTFFRRDPRIRWVSSASGDLLADVRQALEEPAWSS
ncbi:MAG: tRNA (adenosine(37)-N6)-dimethylallyltransferase MiaA [Acidimicrobiia bacterium]